MKNEVRQRLLDAGACAVGFASAEPVDDEEWRRFQSWLKAGYNAGMDYMANYPEIKRDPRLLLEGARTIISLAFDYRPAEFRPLSYPMIAAYAYGDDYHDALRKRLRPIVKELREKIGGEWRICIDSAPIREKYWAQKAGIGYRGDNGAIIIPGIGSMVFLVELITTNDFEPDESCSKNCDHCGACLKACPTGALSEDGLIDSRRCLNYLTIEHRGQWEDTISVEIMASAAGRNTFFGCDRCLRVCHYNSPDRNPRNNTLIPEFSPRQEILSLADSSMTEINAEMMKYRLQRSPLRRSGQEGLQRNLSNIRRP